MLGGSRGDIQPCGAQHGRDGEQGMKAVPKSHFSLSPSYVSKPGETQPCAWLGVSHRRHRCPQRPPAPRSSGKGCGEGDLRSLGCPAAPASLAAPPALPAACGAGCHRLPAAGNSRGLGAGRQSTSGRGCCRDPPRPGQPGAQLCLWGGGGGLEEKPGGLRLGQSRA